MLECQLVGWWVLVECEWSRGTVQVNWTYLMDAMGEISTS